MSNILEEGFTGRPEPRLSDKETDEQYDARVWPLKRMWDASMKTIDDIADGRASDRLRWDPFGTVMTAMSGPMMIVPLAEGAGALVARSGTRAAAAGTQQASHGRQVRPPGAPVSSHGSRRERARPIGW